MKAGLCFRNPTHAGKKEERLGILQERWISEATLFLKNLPEHRAGMCGIKLWAVYGETLYFKDLHTTSFLTYYNT